MTHNSSAGVQVWFLDANDLRNNDEMASKKVKEDTKKAWKEIKIGVQSTPTMVFSVIGDSDSFVPRPWPKTVFQTALIEAAKSGGETWILFRGNDDGLSKIVKDAYGNYEYLHFQTETITKEDPKRHVKLISIARNKNNKQSMKKQRDSVVHKCEIGEGMCFLLEFEKFVSEQKVFYFGQDMEFNIHIPIAIIVCEGDIETISHISKALRMQLPVIIMKGSGKAADVVLEYLENQCSLPKKSSHLFGIHFDGAEYKKMKQHLQHIDNNRDLIGVFDLERDDPLMLSSIVGEMIITSRSIKNIHNIDKKKGDVPTKNQFAQTFYKPHSPVAKTYMADNIIDEKTLLKGLKWGSRPYVFNPKYCSSTTLPLYFYFGYQIWQGLKKKKNVDRFFFLRH